MDILERLAKRTGEADEAVLQDCIECAKEAVLSRRFPNGDWPTRKVPLLDEQGDAVIGADGEPETAEETYIEPQYQNLWYRIAMDLYNKSGAEGETSHSENGISRTFESSWISEQLLSEITPKCYVPK